MTGEPTQLESDTLTPEKAFDNLKRLLHIELKRLNDELTAARAEIADLTNERIRLNQLLSNGGIALLIAENNKLKSELAEARAEITKYKSIAEKAISDHELSEIRNHKLTEQRDRLAEAIRAYLKEETSAIALQTALSTINQKPE